MHISHDIIIMVMTARIKFFYCACANELTVNNGNRGEIMEKLRGELWEGRAVDGKLKSSLEWPKGCCIDSAQTISWLSARCRPAPVLRGTEGCVT